MFQFQPCKTIKSLNPWMVVVVDVVVDVVAGVVVDCVVVVFVRRNTGWFCGGASASGAGWGTGALGKKLELIGEAGAKGGASPRGLRN